MADDTTTTITDSTSGAPITANANGSGTNPGTPAAEKQFTQADLDRAIEARLARERKQADERTARERTQAEQDQLAARAEWEELARQHEQAVREITPRLETAEGRYSALADRLNKQIDAGIREWPAEARKLVPAADDVAARLDAYENMRGLLEKGLLAAHQPGNRPGPRPAGGPSAAQQTEELLRANPRYNSI